MDSINQIAKIVNNIKDTSDFAAGRKPRKKRVERALDTFDLLVPFTMDFRATEKNSTYISLYFKPPAPSACCGTCYCSVCEQFSNNLTITLTYGYISGTVNVFVGSDIHNAVQVTDFTELDPDAGTLQLGTTGEFIRVCYIYFAGGCDPLAPPPCIDVSLGVIQGFSNRSTSYAVERTRTAGGDTDNRFTIGTTNNFARVGGSRSTANSSPANETMRRLFFTHAAPTGAVSAHLRLQLEGTYNLGSFGAGYTGSIPIEYQFRSGNWGAALPVWSDAGAVIESGAVNLSTGGGVVTGPSAVTVDITLPVVSGRVQWVMEISQDQTSFTGRVIDVTHAPITVTRYPSIEDEREYFPELYFKLVGNTLGLAGARNYELEFYSSDC